MTPADSGPVTFVDMVLALLESQFPNVNSSLYRGASRAGVDQDALDTVVAEIRSRLD